MNSEGKFNMKRYICSTSEQSKIEISSYPDYMQNAVKHMLEEPKWSNIKSENDILTILEITEKAVPLIEEKTGLKPRVSYTGPNYENPIVIGITLLGLDNPTVFSAVTDTDVDATNVVSDLLTKMTKALKKEYSERPDKGEILPEKFVEHAMSLKGMGKNSISDSEKVKEWASPLLLGIYRRNKPKEY